MGELITAEKARYNSECFRQSLVSEHAKTMLDIIHREIVKTSTTSDVKRVYVSFFGTMYKHEKSIYKELEKILVKQARYAVEYKEQEDDSYPAIIITW